MRRLYAGAQSAYNALSDEAKALISKNLKAKLDAAVRQDRAAAEDQPERIR